MVFVGASKTKTMGGESAARGPDPDPAYLPALEAVRLWAQGIADAAGPGWRVDRCLQPPFGWDLTDPDGVVVASGPLERLEEWVVLRGNGDGAR
ncbi:hypothetical protein [Nocardia sp. NPDC051570]|uniref:hypothetical protein n=1 Tax=Nocardia sp. NPDC051570 TaxID=3364324 RepID=UPI0037B19CFC